MTGWTELALAFAAFLGTHAVPARPAVRGPLVAMLGERLYLALYGGVSLVLLGWLIDAAGRAPYLELWAFQPWQLWLPNVAMPLACLFAAYGAGAVNPLSFAGRRPEAFEPAAPGIAGVVRHPLLWAFLLWSVSHIVPNGDLAHALLFGSFAAFAGLGMVLLDRRQRRRLGPDEWRRLTARTSFLPFAALLAGRWRPRRPTAFRPWRLLLAIALYLLFVFGHPFVIGVSPLPLS